MPNVFPDIYPTVWEPDNQPAQESDFDARDAFLQINSYDPVDPLFMHAEWSMLSRTERDQIKAHRDANKDRSFTLFDYWSSTVSALFLANGTGAATVFTLPAKSVAGLSVTVNGVLAAPQPTLSAGTGTDGQDRITFSAAPANGAPIRWSATDARLFYEVLYRVVRWSPRHREADVWSVSIDFVQKVGG
jgi:hypothetical protein